MDWKRMKGLYKAINKCPTCGGEFPDNEFDFEDGRCFYCTFPQVPKSLPTEFNRDYGYPINTTKERELLNNLEDIPSNPRNDPISKKEQNLLRKIRAPKSKKKRKKRTKSKDLYK